MTKARDISKLLSTANGKIAGANLDVSFENISDTGTAGTKVASGTTGQRGSTAGQIRFNTTTGLAEYYDGTLFKSIDSPPTISSISPSTALSANTSITITGNNFASGATVQFIGNDLTVYNSPTVTVNSPTSITALTPATALAVANEPYDVKVTNISGLSATLSDALDAGSSPAWSTASGQIGGSIFENQSVSTSVLATDVDAGQSITYAVVSGALPTGLSLNSSTGAITGTAPSVAGDTTSTFSISASDGTNLATRSFNIIIKNDTLLEGLVALYATGNITDTSGNGYNGTIVGTNSASVTLVTDAGTPFGSRQVTSFPNAGGYIDLPLSTIIQGSNPRTITLWFKPNGASSDDNYLFGFGVNDISRTFNARNNLSKMSFMGYGDDYDGNGDTIWSAGVWKRVFYTFSSGTVGAYYLNDAGARVTSWTVGKSLNTGSARARIGSHHDSGTGDGISGCDGRICDFRIYNRVLTQAEMESLYTR